MTTTNFVLLTAEAQKQALAALKQAQDLSLQATELAIGLGTGKAGDVLGELPSPTAAIEGAFGFAGQVLQQQKAYALRMTELMTEAANAGRRAVEEAVAAK